MSRGQPTPPPETGPQPRGLARGLRNEPISFLLLIVSLWLFVGAWIIGYPFTEPAVDAHTIEILVGIVVFCVALARLIRPRGRVSDVLVLAAGVLLIVAPFVVGYGDTAAADAARVNDITVGCVLVLLALVSLAIALTASRAGRPPGSRSPSPRGRRHP
ncbi:SPW repeat domain-containing protein [Streptomyces sp. NEAU-W12]|uniref:SPW repeat domain-containing protein n=1 Tax=Streptomyces sp. NEAU-W12 TaxID=2994668 RepID=UPI00224B8B99|nr:SPW repeat protein [Streptomyces sp. NEAU-W12]MCX2924442.1 SPW repeat protein [Streptomyces sp. NEAU-W12]